MNPRPSICLDRQPVLAIWELTRACDLVCLHCRACATSERDARELSTAEGMRLIDSLASMGTPTLVLTGGDPAKRPDVPELIAHGARHRIEVAVTPSGTPTTTREVLTAWRDAGLARIAVSVDGPDASTHDAFRGVPGSFTESLRILEEARALGLSTQVNTSLHPGNVDRLREMAALVERVGASLFAVFVVVPTGRAGDALLLGPTRLERALEELADLAGMARFAVKTTAAPHYRRVLLQRHARAARLGLLTDLDPNGTVRGQRGVTDGVGIVFVSHTGDIYPSGFLPLPAGNVRTDDVARVYRESPLFRRLRDADALEGKCGVCAFRRVCGGSRARAFARTGNVLGEDPHCAYVPPGYAPRAVAAMPGH